MERLRRAWMGLVIWIAFAPLAWAEEGQVHRWGVETSVTFPFVRIYLVQATYRIWEQGDVIFGPCYQNWKNDEGEASAYTLTLGYRQYFWKGAHLELALFPAYNTVHSTIDGKDYGGLELWAEAYLGYKFSIPIGELALTITPQPGIGFGLYRQNKWPDFDKQPSVIFIPQLMVGVDF